MPRNFVFRLLLIGLALIIGRVSCLANAGNPHPLAYLNYDMKILKSLCDTLPENKNANAEAREKKEPALIKEVPKSRKQVKPVAVPANMVNVKPIKVIKPRIIKPIIKIN